MNKTERGEPKLTLEQRFADTIEKKFNGDPGIAQKLLEWGGGVTEYKDDVYGINIYGPRDSTDVRTLLTFDGKEKKMHIHVSLAFRGNTVSLYEELGIENIKKIKFSKTVGSVILLTSKRGFSISEHGGIFGFSF